MVVDKRSEKPADRAQCCESFCLVTFAAIVTREFVNGTALASFDDRHLVSCMALLT